MAEWLAPGDEWPTHSRAAAGIRALRANGWWLRPSTGGTGKVYGSIRCQPPDGLRRGEGKSCQETIYKTAGGDSATDAFIQDWIRSCPHGDEEPDPPTPLVGSDAPLEASLTAAHFHMDQAEKLCQALEGLATERQFQAEALELWQAAEAATARADQTLRTTLSRQADEAVDAAQEAWDAAQDSVRNAGLEPTPWPPPPGQLEGMADGFLDAASDALPDVDAEGVRQTSQRLVALRRRLEALRP